MKWLDPQNAEVLWMSAFAFTLFGGDPARGRELFDRALAINPNAAMGLAWSCCEADRLRGFCGEVLGPGLEGALAVAEGGKRHRRREGWIEGDGTVEAADGLVQALLGALVVELQGAQVEVAGVQARHRLLLDAGELGELQLRRD